MLKALFNGLLIILLFFATLGFIAKQLEKPDFLVEQSRKANLYGRLSNELPNLFPKGFGDNLKPLTAEDTTDVIRETVDADTFYNFLDSYLTTELNWLTGKSEQSRFTYNLIPIKDKAAEKLTQKRLAKYHALPECQTSQLRGWDATKTFPVCQLPEDNVKNNDIERIFHEQSVTALDPLPNELATKEPSASLNGIRERVGAVNTGIVGIWLATALLIGLYVLFMRQRSFGSLATILILVGLIQVGFSMIAWDWLGRTVGDFFSGSGETAALAPIIVDITTTILEVLKSILGNLSIVFLGGGVMFMVLAIIAKIHRPKILPTTSA